MGALIAGMWGTTNLRALLIEGAGGSAHIAETRAGPGVALTPKGGFEKTLFDCIGDWATRYPGAPVCLAGMIGSSIGWADAGYVKCPASPEQFRPGAQLYVRNRTITIIQGLSCRNRFDEPDIMRGEEIEIAGWIVRSPENRLGRRLVCVPGTHAKWAVVENGMIVDFMTGVPGELYASLRSFGVLVPSDLAAPDQVTPAFIEGVRDAAASGASLVHQIFSVRSRRVISGCSDVDAAQRLSGLLIGADITGALRCAGTERADKPVIVIGARAVAERYAVGLEALGVAAEAFDSGVMAAAGFRAFADACQGGSEYGAA